MLIAFFNKLCDISIVDNRPMRSLSHSSRLMPVAHGRLTGYSETIVHKGCHVSQPTSRPSDQKRVYRYQSEMLWITSKCNSARPH
jgi:hypothetical protein